MIDFINIYPTGDKWDAQVNRDGVTIFVPDFFAEYPELRNGLLALAKAAKTPEEEAFGRTFEILENSATDEQLLGLADVIPEWELEENYNKGAVRRYHGKVYRCIQKHDSQSNREPDKASSLWIEIGEDEASGGGIIAWFEPTSEHYYILGQLMRYTDGKVYESLLNKNVWSPKSYAAGWKYREDLE